ncbi:AmmeMemoRadiSam system protein A [Desulfitispora alkaliphila]|uniref:AmmeMemoRadiSam system protein A n=1 Tax=Desulfitispora alkaliphila TaxID=622674 RepID=UPI003D26010A
METLKANESIPAKIARTVVENSVRSDKKLKFIPKDVEPPFHKPAGAFVSIIKEGQLRGCMGTVQPTKENVAEEIVCNAIEAGFNDSRFEPIQMDELDQLTYSVDILGAVEQVTSEEQLDPQRYGVIVKSGEKKGTLLPNLPGIETAEAQVRIAKEKAGIGPGEPVELERFEVTRYH